MVLTGIERVNSNFDHDLGRPCARANGGDTAGFWASAVREGRFLQRKECPLHDAHRRSQTRTDPRVHLWRQRPYFPDLHTAGGFFAGIFIDAVWLLCYGYPKSLTLGRHALQATRSGREHGSDPRNCPVWQCGGFLPSGDEEDAREWELAHFSGRA